MRWLKIVVVLIILIGLGYLGKTLVGDTSDDQILVALDGATKDAIARGEYTVPEGVTYVESKDCEGTEWIKQQVCSLNGKPMDGTEESCGAGKEKWILDPNHANFKPATGEGKCEPQERDCEVPCPVPCEGDTWIEGACVRKEIVDGAIVETVLDGTSGKCGDGITVFDLDKNAPDFKPAVGKGLCVVEKGGACHVPCPVPEPPKCVEYAPGWQDNDMGCVRSQTDLRRVRCGQTGTLNQYRVPIDPRNCPELTRWVDCQGPPCPIDCEGEWSAWSAPKSDEPCGVQPYKERTFTITTQAAHGGYACDYPHGDTETRNSGSPLTCCEETGDWAMVGECLSDGTAKYTQTYKENKPGGCPESAKAKFMACCYQAGDWTDKPGSVCNASGKKTQVQTVKNCPESYKTREVDCKYISEWQAIGGCGADGKQHYTRTVINGTESTSKSEDCCYKGSWSGWIQVQPCNGRTRTVTRTRSVMNCPSTEVASETIDETCNHCEGEEYLDYSSPRPGGSRPCIGGKYKKTTLYPHMYRITKSATNGGNPCPREEGMFEYYSVSEILSC